MRLSLIVAMAKGNVIGVNNSLPWHLPEDLQYFKAVTMGKPLIMGRKTFESIGRPLPGRVNIVVTRNAAWHFEGVTTVNTLEGAIEVAKTVSESSNQEQTEVMIIGGAEIYRQALAFVTRLYVTEVELTIEGDAFFPEIRPDNWLMVKEMAQISALGVKYCFKVYDRLD